MIFLSYASEDRARVEPVYDFLDNHSLDPWMDCRKLLGGQNWDYEIRTALDRSDIIVVFVSSNSVDKRGYAQREIKLALDRAQEKLVDDIFIVPVLLDNVAYVESLKSLQFLDAREPNFEHSLLSSVQKGVKNQTDIADDRREGDDVSWTVSEVKSGYNGIPGYSTTVARLDFTSRKYPNVSEISDHINGTLTEYAMNARESTLSPNPEVFHLAQNEWRRTNTFDAIFDSARVSGRILSVRFSMHWYHAGAAHPIHASKSFNYLLEPICFLKNARDLFQSGDSLAVLQQVVHEELVQELCEGNAGEDDLRWIKDGTSKWSDFDNFTFADGEIVFQFGSYQVACYAAGMPMVSVSYDEIKNHFSDAVLHALDLYRT